MLIQEKKFKEYNKRGMGILLIRVCAAEKTQRKLIFHSFRCPYVSH